MRAAAQGRVLMAAACRPVPTAPACPCLQVKRLLPDPHSVRGVAYAKDPALVLDGAILRPPSVPPSPTRPASTATAAAPAVVLAASACQGLAGMEVDEPGDLPAIPLNQQRKDAIRAKQAASAHGGGGAAEGLTADGLAAALQAASLQTPGIPSAPGQQQRSQADWLQSVFDKGVQQPGAPPTGAAGIPAGPHPSFLQRQVQQHLSSALPPGIPSGKTAGSGGNAIHLTASAGGAVWRGEGEGDVQRVDLRPNAVTVSEVWGGRVCSGSAHHLECGVCSLRRAAALR